MKELTIEQKEKSYDEALERMKSWVKGEHPECFSEAQKAAEFIFPELKESEDERIRKNCIHFLELQKSHHAATFEIEECIAWLESLKDRVLPQPKQEWSEEDEKMLKDILVYVNFEKLRDVSEKFDINLTMDYTVHQDETQVDFLRLKIKRGGWYKCVKDVMDYKCEIRLFTKDEYYICPKDGMLVTDNNKTMQWQEWHHPEKCFVEVKNK